LGNNSATCGYVDLVEAILPLYNRVRGQCVVAFLLDYATNLPETLRLKIEQTQMTWAHLMKYACKMAAIVKAIHDHQPPLLHNCLTVDAFALRVDRETGEETVILRNWFRSTFASDHRRLRQISRKYDAPECWKLGRPSFKSDVFSFGITLWDLGLLMNTPADPIAWQKEQQEQKTPQKLSYYIPPALKESDNTKTSIPYGFFSEKFGLSD